MIADFHILRSSLVINHSMILRRVMLACKKFVNYLLIHSRLKSMNQ